jgi:predicted dehydrogenase
MAKLRLAFVGTGGMGQVAHLRNYIAEPDCEVVAAAELRHEMAKMVGVRYGIPRIYKDHRELLAAEKQIDGIVAIQQFSVHGKLIPDLLAAKVPVLTEKPLANSLQAGQRLVAAQQKAGVPLYLAYHKRSDLASMYVRRKIEAWKQSGEFGAMKMVRITMPPGDWCASGFSHLINSSEPYPSLGRDGLPEGMTQEQHKQYEWFVNYYIHQVNLMRYLLGENYRPQYAEPTATVMVVRSDKGVPGVIEMSPYQTSIDWQESALIAFEKGWIKLELPCPLAVDQPGRVTVFEDLGKDREPRTTVPVLPMIHAMRQQARNFLAALRGEKTVLCEATEALADLEVSTQYLDLLNKAKAAH